MLPSMPMAIAGLYVGVNALLVLLLTLHVARTRRRLEVYFGDGGSAEMQRALRAQMSALESVPIAMVLLIVLAALGNPNWSLHLFGTGFTAGRLLHTAYFTVPAAPGWLRDIGAFATTFAIGSAAIIATAHGVAAIA